MDHATTDTASRPGGNAIVNRIRDTATAQLNTQKTKATDGLGTVASAVRETTQTLRSQQHDVAARYVEQAADQIERFSERLRNKDVTELLADAQQLARRRPALFVGAAFALGVLGARFLKSTAPDSTEYGTAFGGRESAGSYAHSEHIPATAGYNPGTNAPAASTTGAATERH